MIEGFDHYNIMLANFNANRIVSFEISKDFWFLWVIVVNEKTDYAENQAFFKEYIRFKHIPNLEKLTVKITHFSFCSPV